MISYGPALVIVEVNKILNQGVMVQGLVIFGVSRIVE